jgi:hypothetical protein
MDFTYRKYTKFAMAVKMAEIYEKPIKKEKRP